MFLEITEIAETVDALPSTRKHGIEQVPARLRLLRKWLLNEMTDMALPGAPYSSLAKQWLSDFQSKLS